MVLAELGGQLRDALRSWQKGGAKSTQVQSLVTEITRALIAADVQIHLVQTLRQNVLKTVEPLLEDLDSEDEEENQESARRQAQSARLAKVVQKAVVEELVALLTPLTPDGKKIKPYQMRKGRSNVILFVGLQGAGKTTTIAKFCRHYQQKGWKTAMVCADTFRAGALDQLKQNATKLRIPFYGSYRQADPVVLAQEGVAQFQRDNYEVIVVDTSGRHQQETALLEEMQEIAAAIQPDNTILVLDATQGQAVFDQAAAFDAAVAVGSVICTKLDGHAKGGGALSAVSATQSPIIFLGSGEHFDDLNPFAADSFVSQLLGMGDVRGIMEALRGPEEDQKQLMDRMAKGEFTLRMMYGQFEKILSLGSVGKMAGMMPNMPDYLMPKGGANDEATNRLKKFMIMMDSMRDAELDGKVDWHNKTGTTDKASLDKRIRRIATGSGCHPTEVRMLLIAHKQFEGVVHKMKGLTGNKQQAAQQKQMAAQWRKNPQLMQQHLNKMDPKVIQQMGGRDQVMTVMQQMARGGGGPGGAAGGGMPDLSALMGGMGGGMPGMGGGGMPGMGGGGMPNMQQLQAMMQQMGGGGGMPGMGGGGGMPDMQQLQAMMQQMGGGGGMPGMGGDGGMPDMEAMMRGMNMGKR